MARSSEIALFYGFLLFSLFSIRALADRVFSATTGMTFGRSSREPKYTIEFHSAESPFHPSIDLETMMMSDNEGKTYMCYLPTVEETKTFKPVNQHNLSSIIVGTGNKLKTPDELIEVLRGGCFYRHEGWWSYEFCYHKKVRQLHLEEENKVTQEFVLGEFDPEATASYNQNHSDISTLKDPRSKDASQRYHAHIYTNGTVCDLTNQPRETEVRFVCSESTVMISSIKEISTCKYAVTIQCPMLCKHPMFQQEKPAWHTIHCNEMPLGAKDKDSEKESHGQIIVVPDAAE